MGSSTPTESQGINADLLRSGNRPPQRMEPKPPPPPGGRHCWAQTDPVNPWKQEAGLLVDWRRDGDGWWGRVVLASITDEGRVTVTDTWLPADRLRPGT
jgi:hypothetical protein